MNENEDGDIKVKVCEICGEAGDDIVACRLCGMQFCSECGYPEKNLCFDCGDEVDEGLEDEADESLTDSGETE